MKRVLDDRPLTPQEIGARYRERHREECLRRNAKWAKENRRSRPHDPAAHKRRVEAKLAADPIGYRKGVRDAFLRSHYGITLDDFDRMLCDQTGVCAICGRPETRQRDGIMLPLVVDHNHETGLVRSLLCHRCNSVVGYSGESPEVLRRAADYLERFGK